MLVYPKIALVIMLFQAVFIVGCGCDGIIWSSRAGLSLDGWPLFRAYFHLDGVVKTSIYCVVCPVAIRWHTICMVKARHRTLLLGVCAYLYICVFT